MILEDNTNTLLTLSEAGDILEELTQAIYSLELDFGIDPETPRLTCGELRHAFDEYLGAVIGRREKVAA